MEEAPPRARSASSFPTRYEGILRALGPSKWLVGESSILIDPQTPIVQKRGKAEVGAWVIVWGQQQTDGQIRAEIIQVDRPPGWSGPTIQISGVLRKQTDKWWVVEQTLIDITADTVISGKPTSGALVWVIAVQQGDAYRALAATVLAPNPENPPFEFEGQIESFAPNLLRVDGRDLILDNETAIIGEPAIGRFAEVLAIQQADGRLLARMIRVVDLSAEAHLNAMVAEIATEADGTQRWEIIVFPMSPWADPAVGTLRVDDNTHVDESRATVQIGQWADIRGINLGDGTYQADIVRLERPIPVSLTGEVLPAPNTTPASGWGQISGQPVWFGSVGSRLAGVQAPVGGNVTVVGLRLGNGVIWAKQVRGVGQ